MTSERGRPRIVGRIIDPLVGEPGGSEPAFSESGGGEERVPVSSGPPAEIRPVTLPPIDFDITPPPPKSSLALGGKSPFSASLPELPEPGEVEYTEPRSVEPRYAAEVAGTEVGADEDFGPSSFRGGALGEGSEPRVKDSIQFSPEKYDGEQARGEAPIRFSDSVRGSTPTPTPTPVARGGAMRELLLARAREADPERARQLEGPTSYDGLDEIGRDFSPPTSPIERQLDEIGQSQSSRGAPALVRSKTGVSPNWLAVFGSVFGVATVVCVVLVLKNVAPREFPTGITPLAKVEKVEENKAPEVSPAEPEKPKRVKQPGPWRIADDKGKDGMRVIEGEIGRNPFLTAVQEAGLERAQAYRVLTAFKDVRNLDKCARTDRFVALVDRASKRLVAFEYEVSKEEVYQAREDSGGLLKGSKLDLKVDNAQAKGALLISGAGFDVDAQRYGLEAGLARVVTNALKGHTSIDQFKVGDVIKVVAQEVTVLGEFARYAGIEALEYIPQGNPEKALRVFYFRGSRSKGYFDEKGRSPSEGGWRNPLPGAPLTSHFNPNRMHPVLKRRMPHNGTDYGAPTGTPVYASSFGTVRFMGDGGPAGNLVMLSHADDIETGYAHLSRFAEGLKVGDRVERMQLVGYVGSTGRSTGPHLHFIAKRKGQYIDPLSLKLDALRVLPSGERAEFDEFKRPYLALLAEIPTPTSPSQPEEAPTAAPAAANDSAEQGAGGADSESNSDSSSAGLPESSVVFQPSGAAPKPGQSRGVDLSKSALHLSDEELLKAQPRSDDGEVD